jgi:hypothetical protein
MALEASRVRVAGFVVLMAIVAAGNARGQTTAAGTAAADADAAAWSFLASAYTYVLPDGANYVQPTVTANHGWLHLEARFNYEERDTGSGWFGYNFSVGEQVTLEITPMIGVIFGKTDGIAPGYRGSIGWRRLELSSESEYVFDANDSASNFLYTWSELTFAPADWWRVGLAVQRTKAYRTEFDIQRGFVVGLSVKRAELSAYVFNPDLSHPTMVFAVGLTF